MPANVVTPWTVGGAIVLVAVVALAAIPTIAQAAAERVGRLRDIFYRLASAIFTSIKNLWGLAGEKENQSRRIRAKAAADPEIQQQRRYLYELYGLPAPAAGQQARDAKPARGKRALFQRLRGGPKTSQQDPPAALAAVQAAVAVGAEMPAHQTPQAAAADVVGMSPQQVKKQFDDAKEKLEATTGAYRTINAQVAAAIRDKYGEAANPTIGVIATAWARRLIYLLLAFVCIASDYVLVSSRAPILFGGGTPPAFLVFLFKYLQVITGLLFVSIAVLSGMLIQEQTKGLDEAVKLEPDISDTERRIKLGLAISMIVGDAIVVTTLTLAGVNVQYSVAQPLAVIYVIFIGASLMVAIGIFLAQDGLLAGALALVWLVVGGALALTCAVIGTVFALVALVLSLLDGLNLLLFGRRRPREEHQIPPDKRDLAIIGYGAEGSHFAVGVCEQLGKLYGPFARLAGIYYPGANVSSQLRKRLKSSRAAAADISIDPNANERDPAGTLKRSLQTYYATTMREMAKTLFWIVAGDDLQGCLPTLKTVGAGTDIQNLQLVILWLVPPADTRQTKATYATLADALKTWKNEDGSTPLATLATTIVIERESPLARAMGNPADAILLRSVAALLGAGARGEVSFARVAAQLHNAGYPFSALMAGAIGVDVAPSAFNEGLIVGNGGDINPVAAARTLKNLAEAAFSRQQLSTVNDLWGEPMPDPTNAAPMVAKPTLPSNKVAAPPAPQLDDERWREQQSVVFVNVVVPLRLHLVKEFKDLITNWLRTLYAVNQQQVAVVRTGDERDRGVDVSRVNEDWKGTYYFHFTVLRGVGTAPGTTPRALKAPPKQSDEQEDTGGPPGDGMNGAWQGTSAPPTASMPVGAEWMTGGGVS